MSHLIKIYAVCKFMCFRISLLKTYTDKALKNQAGQNLTSFETSVIEFGLFNCLAEPGRLLLLDAAEWIPEPARLRFKSSTPAARPRDDILCKC